MAQLNPLLADGHLFVGLPDWRDNSAKAVKHGVALFPFEVALDQAGNLLITAALGGSETPLAGARIKRINGRDARQVTRELLARAHGDSLAFRMALLSQRWRLFYQNVYGTPGAFDLRKAVVRVALAARGAMKMLFMVSPPSPSACMHANQDEA